MTTTIKKWTSDNIPSLRGKTVIVTGTGGIGFETILMLASAGAKVIMAGRNATKGAKSISDIKSRFPEVDIEFEQLDLADLSSIQKFSERMLKQLDQLDILVNNAAVMNPPHRQLTKDGFELQFGTNYLGPFALTGQLLPLLKSSSYARVVTVSSIANHQGKIDFDNLQSDKSYIPMDAYAQSKLADLMFAFELQRKSDSKGWGISSFAAHPGVSRTELIPNGAGRNSPAGIIRRVFGPVLFQPASHGAWPSLYCASMIDAKSGTYYGPRSLGETRGYPTFARVPDAAKDLNVAAKLWEVSEQLTHVTFK